MARAATLPSPFSQQAAAAGVVLPADVRLMQATANTVLALVVLGLLAAGLQRLARAPIFNIQAIRIEGDVSRNSESTIRANAAPRLAGSFLTLDLQQARNAFEAVPWVRHAVVRRSWPDRLLVTLDEHRAAALWQGDDRGDRLVNSQGEVFEANVGDVEDEALPMFTGPEGSAAAMLTMYRRLVPVLAPLSAIDSLTLSSRGSWRVVLDIGATLELGRGSDDEVVHRTTRFVASWPEMQKRFAQQPLEAADLRHTDGYALRMRGVTTPQAGAGAPKRN